MSYSYNNIISKPAPKDGESLLGNLLSRDSDVKPTAVQLEDVDATIVSDLLSAKECDEILAGCEKLGWTFWADDAVNKDEDGATQSAAPAAAAKDDDEEEEAMLPGERNFLKGGMDLDEDEDEQSAENKGENATHGKKFRSADTIEIDLKNLSDVMWSRLAPFLQKPEVTYSEEMDDADNLFERDMEGRWVASGFHPNLLFARYLDGGHFAPHVDGTNVVDLNTRSLYTVLVYLNDCEVGGETRIMTGDQCEVLHDNTEAGRIEGNGKNVIRAVKPLKGQAVVFYHNVLHEGVAVGEGHSKYIIRGDVLFRRTPPILTEPADLEAFELYQNARITEANGKTMKAMKMFQRIRKLSPGLADLYQL